MLGVPPESQSPAAAAAPPASAASAAAARLPQGAGRSVAAAPVSVRPVTVQPVSAQLAPRRDGPGGPPTSSAHRFAGTGVSGADRPGRAPLLAVGTYTDTIGPGQTRWYAVRLDAADTADLSATAAPAPGAAVAYGDGLELELLTAAEPAGTCDKASARFRQREGAMNLTGAVSRIPSQDHRAACDAAGRYLLSVHRTTSAGSDGARWPVELAFAVEPALPSGTVPAGARTDYGPAPAPVTGTPEAVTGGSGFNDAARIATGVWRDRVPPGGTRYYKVRLGWGQQLTYTADFADAPTGQDGGGASGRASALVTTSLRGPGRIPVPDASGARTDRLWDGSPVAVGLGTDPVSWTNRWVDDAAARGVRQAGDYWIAVGLGPDASGLAGGTAVDVVLRVRVSGRELPGPQYVAQQPDGRVGADGAGAGAPAARGSGAAAGPEAAGAPGGGAARTTGRDWLAAGTGGGAALAGLLVAALVHRLRTRPERGAPGMRTRTDRTGL